MSTTSLIQRSHLAFAAITSSRQHFFDASFFRSSSSLALHSHRITSSGVEFTGRRHPTSSPITKRNASSVVRSGLKDLLTRDDKPKVKETMEFYIHEIRSADPSDKTATLKVAGLPINTKPLEWGSSFVFDNEVLEGAGADSTLLGRERGWGVVTDQKGEEALQLWSKISFTEGKYKGSTITFSGNVGGAKMPYELIIHGGTGHLRGAQGYVLAEKAPNEGPRFKFHWKVFIC